MSKLNLYLMLLLLVLLSGCASLPENYTKTASTAFKDYTSTSIGRFFAQDEIDHPGQSGFGLMRDNRAAFAGRVMLTELAEKSLDVQYYIWESDTTGRVLAKRLIEAADKGVKVRLLIDDNNNAGRDAVVAMLDSHPNLEVRIFNPFSNRTAHIWDFISDFGRVNHRMHNKLMVADNSLAIVGGRNIGDHYFGVNTVSNFRDLDVVAAGPIVREVTHTFDYFWNSDWAFPAAAFAGRSYTESDLQKVVDGLDVDIIEEDYPFPLDEDVQAIKLQMNVVREQFLWAPAGVVWDDPNKIGSKSGTDDIIVALRKKIATLQKELLIESAYFVPGKTGVASLAALEKKGVHVRILTNSMASNDVLPAHAGYAKYRKPLLQHGAQLHELRPDSHTIRSAWVGKSKAALHTKAMVFDRESAFIGSFNLDPRSAVINTEIGIYIESPALAQQVADYMDIGTIPENSYQVVLANGKLNWITRNAGEDVRFTTEPETTVWDRFLSQFIGILPIESQL